MFMMPLCQAVSPGAGNPIWRDFSLARHRAGHTLRIRPALLHSGSLSTLACPANEHSCQPEGRRLDDVARLLDCFDVYYAVAQVAAIECPREAPWAKIARHRAGLPGENGCREQRAGEEGGWNPPRQAL